MTFQPSPSGHPGRDQRLLDQAHAVFVPPIAQVFAAAVAHFDDVLFDRAESAGASQLLFLDGMRELRRKRDEVSSQFRQQLEAGWQALLQGTPLSAEVVLAGDMGTGPLSLVPEHVLESRLAVRNLATVLLRDFKQVLARIDRRLGWIAGGLELVADTNPVGPEHLGVAIHEAFATCDLAPEVRLVLIKLCERDLAEPIGKLYARLDETLAKAGVMPEISQPKRAPPRVQPRDQAQGERSAADGQGFDGEAAGEDPNEQYAPAWANRFLDRWAHSRGRMQAAAQRGSADGHAGGDGDADHPGGSQGMLLDALHELLQQTRNVRENAASAASVAVGQQRPLSQREMMSVLSLLQATPSATLQAAIGDDNESLAQRLKNEVLNSATRLGVDPATAKLDPMDEDAIDLVGMLFDVMLDERDLENRSREMIGRLVVPFVKVALLDRKMFVQKTHPARRLLNSLAEACEGNNGDSAAERVLMGKVEEIVDRLVAEFNENLAIFLTLEEEFRDFLSQHRRRVEIAERRATETQRGQEKLELARARALSELEQRVQAGAPLPKAVEDFLRQPWLHHLTMAILRDGDEGPGTVEALAMADGVLEELAEARRHIIGKPWLQAWQPALHRVFASVGLHGDAVVVAITALHDTLQAIAEARPELEKALPELPQVNLPPPAAESVSVVLGAEAVAQSIDSADAERFRAMDIGTWLDFVDKDGKVQAGKLSWVSPISSRLLFVNRRGVRFCVASPEELAVMVRLGRLREHINDGAFDSAMQGVIDRLDPLNNGTVH
ncbi:DUF1631 domain-containing protein [Xanthomonas campestris]|uniref:DUF1631 domain-containing protein n=1 Tax=Xanthomonas campestris TaxID=339 RepID=UPI0023663007|nr:DUF1631 domain-containing protein [Xanthomonas campestris]MEA9711093.1 DUF1631 domain-containing protein [Xanthomonas campestris]MEA9783517.1 DUF1631 domain-containing protein [Xanthomonas campestris pv. raphani]MEA9791194.1 DUF1631 domain-containing protein [Xanthomonas campestris pv. raphani]MEA9797482.1 DUF1631 domain-containing protein [Xanthomonas campestris pv. raphani]MEA9802324.1 DUF1631 domain-containing protein [Xanthomonas campestris pv. raphani]